jgi:hypothetical protein
VLRQVLLPMYTGPVSDQGPQDTLHPHGKPTPRGEVLSNLGL